MTSTTSTDARARIADEIRKRRRFVLSSHVRPDGDAIGSQLAMAFALWQLGKEVRLVNRGRASAAMMAFPGVSRIENAGRHDDPGDAGIVADAASLTDRGSDCTD